MPENVINLGQVEAPHPNPYGQALEQGAQSIAEGMQNRITNQQKQQQLQIEAVRAKAYQQEQMNKYQMELAKMQHQKDEEDYQHTQTTIKQLGALKSTDPQKYMQMMSGPHGKELISHIKKVSPDNIDDNAQQPWDKIIAPGVKEQASDQLNKFKMDYINKIKNGQPVTDDEKKAFQALQMHGVDVISEASEAVAKQQAQNPGTDLKSAFQSAVQSIWSRKKAQGQTPPGNQAPAQPTDQTSDNSSNQNAYAKYLSSIQGQQ